MQRSAAKVVLGWIMTVAYVFTEHCCRACFGRILRAVDGAHYRCAECGLIVSHPKVTALCACGTKLGNGRLVGLRCQRNPDGPTPEAPAEIVVGLVGAGTQNTAQAPVSQLRDCGGELLNQVVG